MQKRRLTSPIPSLLILAMSSALVACGGGGGSSNPPASPPPPPAAPPPPPPPPPPPAPLMGGRLIYSLESASDTLKMFDQTVASNRFTGTTVAAAAGAELVLANDGLTLAMLEGGQLSVVSSGLAGLEDSPPTTQDVRIVSAAPVSGVTQVIATTDHFSLLRTDGTSILLEAEDGEDKGLVWTDVVYPTLAIEGGQFIKFTANPSNPADTDITIVEADGSTGENGLIFIRPNATGFFAESLTCANGVTETAQTPRFTIALCGDGTVRWMAHGFVAREGHPFAGQTINTSQRYPETVNRREGATGELPSGGSGFIENITALTATRAEEDVIALWASDQLWLVNMHSDHTHRLSTYTALPDNTNIINVASATVDYALTVLSDGGVASTFRYAIDESANPVIASEVFNEQLGSATASWSVERSHMEPGPYDFFVINRDTGTLYFIDAHDPDDDYHLHSTETNADLEDSNSAVFAHVIEEGHGHDHDD